MLLTSWVSWLVALVALSTWQEGNWDWAWGCYGFIIVAPELTPNVGLYWYYFTEAFAHFRAGAKPDRVGLVEAFYPFLGIVLQRTELNLDARRSFGALHDPGIYGTTLTRPALFGEYYRRQIGLLIEHHQVPVIVGISDRRMPLPFVIEDATDDIRNDRIAALEASFALPDMRFIDDAIANGTFRPGPGEAKPLALFTAERVDYSLQRAHHYTATAPEHVQRFILLTNYQRYVDHFIDFAREAVEQGNEYDRFVSPGDAVMVNPRLRDEPDSGTPQASLPQMPAYHLTRPDGRGAEAVVCGLRFGLRAHRRLQHHRHRRPDP